MTDLTALAKALHRVYNDVEEAQAQRFYGEHAHDEWENLAPAEIELWMTLAGHVDALRDSARAEQLQVLVNRVSADLGNDVLPYLEQIEYNARAEQQELLVEAIRLIEDEWSGTSPDSQGNEWLAKARDAVRVE